VGGIFRTTDIVLIAVMVTAAAFTYKTKHDAESQLAELRKVEEQIGFERDLIDVLRADWSLLTQPARLQRLAEQYQSELALEPVEATQIGAFSELPPRPLEIEDVILREAGIETDIETAGTDELATGGIGQ
jgi:hypothetical protein